MGSITILPNDTTMNKECYQNILREKNSTIQFSEDEVLFQHDDAPIHELKAITLHQNLMATGRKLPNWN